MSAISGRRRRRSRRVALALCLLLVDLVGGSRRLMAQSGSSATIAVGTSAMTVPWYPKPLAYRLNPAMLVGTDHLRNSGDGWRFFFAVNVGFLRSHWLFTGISLAPEIGVGRSLPGGFDSDLRLGIGYLHFFWQRKTLKLRDGKYVPARDFGNPSVILPLTVTLGYRGISDSPPRVSPFISARWMIQRPLFSRAPMVPHLLLLGGLRFERESATPTGGK